MTSTQHVNGIGRFMALWMAANLAGWVTGLAGGVLLTQAATSYFNANEDRFVVYAVLFALGFTTGIAQWRVMRDRLPRSAWWIAATVAGYLLCLLLIAGDDALGNILGRAGLWSDALLFVLFGIAIGAPQWWLLRPHYRNAWAWVPAAAAGALIFLWSVANPAHSIGEVILLCAAEGTLASAVPGAAFVWLVADRDRSADVRE